MDKFQAKAVAEQRAMVEQFARRYAAKNAAGLANLYGAAVHRADAEAEIGAAAVRAMVEAGHAVHEPMTGRILVLMG